MRPNGKDAAEQTEDGSSHSISNPPGALSKWSDDKPFDNSLNRRGVVHVRLLEAQGLPCPVGSSVCASVSLPPWQGRVRTQRTEAFLSSLHHGVCVMWKETSDDGLCSMINAWSSDESPVPNIRIELMFSPLRFGLLDFSMSTLLLPCHVLMESPHRWRRQWCQGEMAAPERQSTDQSCSSSVLIHLEAMFAPEPAKPELPPVPCCLDLSPPRPVLHDEDFQELENVVGMDNTESPEKVLYQSSSREAPLVAKQSAISGLAADQRDPHLLRLKSFWVPSSCGVCSKVLFGRNTGFLCEECSIACCGDCRLNVDFRLPCGSDAARAAAALSEHGKMSIENILSVVAPDESFEGKKEPKMETKSVLSENETIDEGIGIGFVKLKFIRAAIFRNSVPNETDPDVVFTETSQGRLRRGDYYARVSISNSSKTGRTPTIQKSGMPLFESEPMEFTVNDYGQEFRLDVVDANTDKPVGTSVLTTQGMLQSQRDEFVQQEGVSLPQVVRGPLCYKGKRKMKLELRKGVRHGFGSVFFDAPTIGGETQQGPSGIIGWMEIEAGLEEYIHKLYKTGFKCPARPPRDLNMANWHEQLNRVKYLAEDIKELVEDTMYIMSWENPRVTALALYIFVAICLRFNSEYWGSLPLLFLLLRMLLLSWRRKHGAKKTTFIRREIAARRKAEEGNVNYLIHRPIGTIRANVTSGSSLLSRDGIPGRTSCRVIWEPMRFATKKVKEKISHIDKASKAHHLIGYTNTRYAVDPTWEIQESIESKRLKHLLPVEEKLPDSIASVGVSFPILQPISLESGLKDTDGRFVDTNLIAWEESPGAIVFQVRFSDLLFGLGFEHVLGEVVIPLSTVLNEGEISGWFNVSSGAENETDLLSRTVPGGFDPESHRDSSLSKNYKMIPRLFIVLEWTPPSNKPNKPTDTEQELAIAIQEEYVRSSKQKKHDFVGSSLGAMNAALGIGGNLQDAQNTLSSILDLIESTQNLFNFADPFKSSCVFCSVMTIWILFIFVPSRFVILSAGLAHFSLTANKKYRFLEKRTKKEFVNQRESMPVSLDVSDEVSHRKEGSWDIWIMNGLRSLPTNEDLRKTYFWESFRSGHNEAEKYLSRKRESRLKQLWKAQWYSKIRIKVRIEAEQASNWMNAFAIVQGHHFLWWKSISGFDSGEDPVGRIFLTGHAGLTGPSPIEMRDLSQEELGLFVGIFGRGLSSQERLAVITPDEILRESLKNAILGASAKDD